MVLQLFRAPRGKTPEAKASAAAPVVAFHGAGRVAWSSRDAATLTDVGFLRNPVAFRCVKVIAEAAAAVPVVVQDLDRRFEAHPVLALVAAPNPGQSGAALMEAFYGHLLLTGDGYLEAAGEHLSGGPRELHVLRPDRMKVVPGSDGWPAAYEYRVGAHRHVFDMAADRPPVLHVKSFHPKDDHYGLSPLQAAASAIDVHNSASAWSKALLDNAARPSGAIVYKGADGQGSLAADQYARLIDELETHHQGARNAGRPMLLEGGLDWKPMGFSPSDMEFHRTKEAAARDVALAFGVPPMLLGLPGDNTYACAESARLTSSHRTRGDG
jgi:HK97 family phage portal protein